VKVLSWLSLVKAEKNQWQALFWIIGNMADIPTK
jgi:hypothetical protein